MAECPDGDLGHFAVGRYPVMVMSGADSNRGLEALWDDHARFDPLWAVLAYDKKRGRAWDLRDFMRQGEREIALAIHRCRQLDLTISFDGALDFGCGVGRLTQALARRFQRAVGVDISAEMIRLANAVNRYPGRAEYVHVTSNGLARLPSGGFDFVYSSIVLQHVPRDLTLGYLDQFLDRLHSGGILVFQLPSHRLEDVSVEIRPMPDSSYQAKLDLCHSVPEILTGGETRQIAVRVVNEGRAPWVQREVGSLRVGNHWFDETGELIVTQDDGRAVMPQVVPSGDTFEIDLAITAPTAPGKYWLEIDAVHEGVTWFAGKSSQPARCLVTVVDGTSASGARLEIDESPVPAYDTSALPLAPLRPGTSAPELFPMYGISREVVVNRLEGKGGEIIEIEDDPRAGHEWLSYRYFVRKV